MNVGPRSVRLEVALVLILLSSALVPAQETVITPPPNKYSVSEDVKLGREAAAQVEKQLPILHDDGVTSYVETIGLRLVQAIPPDLQHPEFEYTFKVVNVKEINAFALPGGPMFVNRGMIEAAHDEGEIAGVMAHELSHVVLRHGTAQQSKAAKYSVGETAGAVLGAIIGGGLGRVVAQGTQLGIGATFLRFSRDYEKQADIEGSHIMARAGYNPRDMANVFQTIEQQGGPGGPQWLSDHPNPGNRSEYILKEADQLTVDNPIRETPEFARVRDRLKSLAPAPSTAEATRNASTAGGDAPLPGGRVEPPSSEYRTYTEGRLFQVSIPANWRELARGSSITFAPQGAYGRGGFSHGIEFAVSRNDTHDLQTATDDVINALARENPNLSRRSRYESITVDGRSGLETTLSNRAGNGSESVVLFTALLPNGNLFYAVGVAPASVFGDYQPTFRRIVDSVRFIE
jgi:hypothetical protein